MQLLGLLSLFFFIAQFIHYLRINQPGNMLWMCNIGTLILAIGLLFQKPNLIRMTTIWAVPGLLVWIIYVVLAWGVFLTSTLTHLGGLAVGLVAVSLVGMNRQGWLYAFIWYLIMQLLCYLFTSPELNVNLAHHIQAGWEQRFSAYWQFWIVLTLVTGAALWLIGFVLGKIWPDTRPQRAIS